MKSPMVLGFVAVGMMALVGCAAESGAAGAAGAAGREGATALTRVEAEPAGATCASGGQAFLVGVDANDNGKLDDAEITDRAYVCHGASAPAAAPAQLTEIPRGDLRCPNGGVAFDVQEGPDLVACNGTDGAKGDQGERGERGEQGADGAQGPQGAEGEKGDTGAAGADGAQGPQGPQGPQGAPAPEQKLGVFLPSQVVKGFVVTCTGTTAAATTVECRGMKVNGLDLYLGPREANAICAGVTGGGYNTASGTGVVPAPWISLNQAGVWAVASSGNASPMHNLTCNK